MNDEELVLALKRDYKTAALGTADRAMLDYVEKLTREPATVVRKDIDRLRAEGFGDRAILDINQICGFFAWCNRTVQGLGVELEDFWDTPGATNL